MTQDDGMDNALPISKEGLLEAILEAKRIALSASQLISMGKPHDAAIELEGLDEYLYRLHENIKEDKCTNYAPVVRKP